MIVRSKNVSTWDFLTQGLSQTGLNLLWAETGGRTAVYQQHMRDYSFIDKI